VPSKHDPVASLADILENLERIEGYVAGLDREAFGGDTLRPRRSRTVPGTHLRNTQLETVELFICPRCTATVSVPLG
jgi:hypothetical protein